MVWAFRKANCRESSTVTFAPPRRAALAGTGIGLSMTNMLIRKHRGKIEAQSKVGEGTTVSIYLPRTDCPELSQATAQAS